MTETGLVQILEGSLLAAGKPLTVAQLGELFEEHERPDNAAIREALQAVAARCDDRGFELVEVASGFRFQVRQALSPWVARLSQERPARYSRALLETLALIAYRQPITRGEIEEIRGVAVSSNIIKTLHEREWVRVVGHRDVPGRPAMYATTRQFLDYFNLKNLDQLPALAEIRDLDTLNAELGFSEPLAAAAEATEGEASEAAPELTVVGGIDHKPATETETETETETPDQASATQAGVPASALAIEGGQAEQLEPSTADDLAGAIDDLQADADMADTAPPTRELDPGSPDAPEQAEPEQPESQGQDLK